MADVGIAYNPHLYKVQWDGKIRYILSNLLYLLNWIFIERVHSFWKMMVNLESQIRQVTSQIPTDLNCKEESN